MLHPVARWSEGVKLARVKLKRFRVEKPSDAVLKRYLRVYDSKDLHQHPDDLPPISPQGLFGSAEPLVFDLGCGRGEFLVARALDQPEQNFVGFDWHWKSVWDAVNRAHAADLDNILFLRTDFRRALSIVPDRSVREGFLLFPPPGLKHSKRQQDPLPADTIRHIFRVLLPDGPFHFITDHPDFFAVKTDLIAATGLFEQQRTAHQFEGGQTRFQEFWERRNVQSHPYEGRAKP
ncbi:MAG: methyltransferase domain-containing protein [Chloroflexi bacterium]|nr:methyltransferase domain-containing protein [Chloroflexota bacterium]